MTSSSYTKHPNNRKRCRRSSFDSYNDDTGGDGECVTYCGCSCNDANNVQVVVDGSGQHQHTSTCHHNNGRQQKCYWSQQQHQQQRQKQQQQWPNRRQLGHFHHRRRNFCHWWIAIMTIIGYVTTNLVSPSYGHTNTNTVQFEQKNLQLSPWIRWQEGQHDTTTTTATRFLKKKKHKTDDENTPKSTEFKGDKDGNSPKESGSGNEDEICLPIESCQRCTLSEQKSYEACQLTGRWMKYQCSTSTTTSEDGDGASSSSSSSVRIEMRSCQYTESDEEFAMVRLQMICILLGGLAIMSVRKNKRLSASLFDQRKQGIQQQQQSSSSSNGSSNGGISSQPVRGARPDKKRSSYITENDEEIEFTPMTNQRQQQQEMEMVPLVGRNDDVDGLNGHSNISDGRLGGIMSPSSYDELEVI